MVFSILIFTLFNILFKTPFFPLSHKDASTCISKKVLRFAFHVWIFNPEIRFLNVIRGRDCLMVMTSGLSTVYWMSVKYKVSISCGSVSLFFSIGLFMIPVLTHCLNYCDLITNLENWWDDCPPSFPWLFQVSLTMPRSLIILVRLWSTCQIPQKTSSQERDWNYVECVELE